jgi:predicted nucleic acid-binding protein
MADLPFVDTNILLRHLLADHPDHSPRATAIINQIERHGLQARTSDTVVFESVFVLERSLGRPKRLIRDALLPLINLPGITLPNKRRLALVLSLYVEFNIPFADAYHAVLAQSEGSGEIISFDTRC